MSKKELDRKQAIKKLGKYAAFTALGTFMLLNPKKAQSQSPPPPGEFGYIKFSLVDQLMKFKNSLILQFRQLQLECFSLN